MNSSRFGSVASTAAFCICVALIASTFVPRVLRQRQAARAAQCTSNMRMLALGVQNYHAAYRRLPPATGGTQSGEEPESSNGGRLGPLVGLSPFVQQQALWEMISNPYQNPENGIRFPSMGPVPWYQPSMYRPWGMAPTIYQCPDDVDPNVNPAGPKIVFTLQSDPPSETTTNYVTCYGDGTWMQAECQSKDEQAVERRSASNRGVFVPATHLSFRDVTDGLSNTALFSETIASRQRLPGLSEIIRDVDGLSRDPSLCLAAANDPNARHWPFGRGSLWADGYLTITGFQTVLPPNSPSCTSDVGLDDPIVSATSRHPGGVYLALCDGAVIFVTDKIDTGDLNQPGVSSEPGYRAPKSESPYGVWGAMGSRAAGEKVSIPDQPPAQANVRRIQTNDPVATLSIWRDKTRRIRLRAEFVRIIDEEQVQLRSQSGTIHQVPLNTLSDYDIYRAVEMDLKRSTK